MLAGALGVPYQIVGAGASLPYFVTIVVPSTAVAAAGSRIWWLTKAAAGPLISLKGAGLRADQGDLGVAGQTLVQGISVYAGVGDHFDGGGGEGILVQSTSYTHLDHIDINNMSSNGIDFAGPGYEQNNVVSNSRVDHNGGQGVLIGQGQQLSFYNNLIAQNFKDGIKWTFGVEGLTLLSNVPQSNNKGSFNPGFNLNPAALIPNGECMIVDNWFETSNSGANTSQYPSSANLAGCILSHNHGDGNVATFRFSAAGTAIPTCTTGWHRKTLCVSDAVACANGTNYTSGGSTRCAFTCDATIPAWVGTGSTAGVDSGC